MTLLLTQIKRKLKVFHDYDYKGPLIVKLFNTTFTITCYILFLLFEKENTQSNQSVDHGIFLQYDICKLLFV